MAPSVSTKDADAFAIDIALATEGELAATLAEVRRAMRDGRAALLAAPNESPERRRLLAEVARLRDRNTVVTAEYAMRGLALPSAVATAATTTSGASAALPVAPRAPVVPPITLRVPPVVAASAAVADVGAESSSASSPVKPPKTEKGTRVAVCGIIEVAGKHGVRTYDHGPPFDEVRVASHVAAMR